MQLILLFLICTICYASVESGASIKPKRSYAFYYPLSMGSEELTEVCLEIDKNLLPATVKIVFINRTSGESIYRPRTEFSCWQIIAPFQARNTINDNYYYYPPSQIELEIECERKGIKLRGQYQVVILPHYETIFIETDRSVYKMGDIVKIRALVLGFDLKSAKNYKISSIKIGTSYPYTVVKEWVNMTMKSGIIQFEFQLGSDVPEGTWSINGDGFYYGFEVQKYVLPRFQVSISGPDSIYNGSKSTSFSVCATYAYGRKVKGIASLIVTNNYGYSSQTKIPSKIKKLETGCAIFVLYTDELDLQNATVNSIELTAVVTEDGTNKRDTTSDFLLINRNPYLYVWDNTYQYIKPGLPYKSKFWLANVHVTLNTRLVQLCYSYALSSNLTCGNFTMDSSNSIDFTIPPLRNITKPQNVKIEANVLDYPLAGQPIGYLAFWVTSSKNAIKIIRTHPDANPTECGATLIFTVLYTSTELKKGKDVTFKYILSSRGEIVSASTVIDKPRKKILNLRKYPNVIGLEDYERDECENQVDSFKLKIKLNNKIYADSKLVVYYNMNNEVIADVIDINVKSCSPLKVDAKWQASPLYPGETGKLDVKADSEALCSVGSIDKESKFLQPYHNIYVDAVIHRFVRYPFFYENCIEFNDTDSLEGSWPYVLSYFDSMQAFRDSNIGVISNMKLINRPCVGQRWLFEDDEPSVGPERTTTSDTATNGNTDHQRSTVRSLFPKTWLWDLVLLGEDGKATLERKLPDSIDDWVGNVICVSPKKGFGISDDIQIIGFQPFFVEVLLPYSIKRNKEILHLPVAIFNYLNHSLPIRINLTTNDDIVLVDGKGRNRFTICLGAGGNYTHTYRIKAIKLGLRNITVAANADPNNVKNCASKSITRRNDIVRKSILIEPEGYPSGIIKSALLCANDSMGMNNIDWKINLPKNVVSGTVNGTVIINSDILGPVFQNLENILVVPTGCGEQTMATLTPNLYVLKYLKAIDALTDKIKGKIVKNLETGYQRMLNYKHNDGSYSAFGNSDKQGSMFLTAFVVRTFKQMKEYIFIDDTLINKAIDWIISHQLQNGCFDPVFHVFHEMGLSSSPNQTTALSSYVLISFLETNTKINGSVLAHAKKCILNDKRIDKYAMAISSYALGLMNLTKNAKDLLDKLMKVAHHKHGMTWWTQSGASLSTNVEISGYVVKSLLLQNPDKNLGVVSSIVKWLQTNMNPSGGFYSTQDTVVALDAISSYATLISKKEPRVKVAVATETEIKSFEIIKRDYTKPNIIPLTVYPNEVKANIQGDGCVSIQASVTYYLDAPVTSKDLKLNISLKSVNETLKCSFVELKLCVSYNASGKINMAIVEVSLPSGYSPEQVSLYGLASGVKKFELVRNQVIFYLIHLDADPVCLPVKIKEKLIVENVADATVKLYDYYKPEVFTYKSFKVDDCGTTAEI